MERIENDILNIYTLTNEQCIRLRYDANPPFLVYNSSGLSTASSTTQFAFGLSTLATVIVLHLYLLLLFLFHYFP